MTPPPPNICKRIRALFRMMGSSNANEKANAEDKLKKLLAERALSWNDIPTIVAIADADDEIQAAAKAAAAAADKAAATDANATSSQTAAPTDRPEVNVLALVLRLIELHVGITPEERMAAALWALHTYVFDRFPVTPRLALLSPVRGCGKTTLLILLELLVANPHRTDNVTAAAIYHLLDLSPRTLLVDEARQSRFARQRPLALGVQRRLSPRRDRSAGSSVVVHADFSPLLRLRWRRSECCRCRCCTAASSSTCSARAGRRSSFWTRPTPNFLLRVSRSKGGRRLRARARTRDAAVAAEPSGRQLARAAGDRR